MAVIIGLDYGKKRVGVAVSDAEQGIAVASTTINVASRETLFQDIQSLVAEKRAVKIVVGLPLSLSGAASAQTDETKKFITALAAHLSIPVESIDERLTSIQADTGGVDATTRDARAAALMLQSYLDRQQALR